VTQKDATRYWNATLAQIRAALLSGRGVNLKTIGSLSVYVRPPRRSFVPYSQTYVDCPPQRNVRFTLSENLRDELRNIRIEP